MLFLNKKLGILFLAIWFAILQAISPFVHAHISATHDSDNQHGLHIHAISLSAANKEVHSASLNDYALDTHIVVLDKGIIQKLQLLGQVCAVLAIFVFFIFQSPAIKLSPRRQSKPPLNRLRISLNPRAPPYF